MVPTQDQVRHVAKLARLHLSEEEVTLYQSQLASIFSYIDTLSEIDITSVSAPQHASRDHMQLRADVIEQMYQPKELIGVTEQEII
jgi:aspartyl-tRNA(Asn)/glutamyl-tRNA(Gln) amidotransferase subunit C